MVPWEPALPALRGRHLRAATEGNRVKALLVIAHGSPRKEANEDVRSVAETIRSRGVFPIVEIGYLDCNEPDIPSAIERCIELGAEQINAVPYLLHSGKHFVRDLPEALEQAAQRHPGVTILMGDYIGRRPEMLDVIRDRIAEIEK